MDDAKHDAPSTPSPPPPAGGRPDAAPAEQGLITRTLAAVRGALDPPQVEKAALEEFHLGERLADAKLKPPHETLEGVSMGDLLRCKIQYLAAQNRALKQESQFADAKSATLMTVIGLLIVNGPFASDYRTSADLVSLSVLVLAACGFASSLYALVPRFPNAATREYIAQRDVYSWPGLASETMDHEAYAQFVRDSQATHLILSMARSNGALAKIILNKYSALRFGFGFGLTAFATFGFDFLFFNQST